MGSLPHDVFLLLDREDDARLRGSPISWDVLFRVSRMLARHDAGRSRTLGGGIPAENLRIHYSHAET